MTTLLLAAAVTIQQHGIEPQKAMEQIAWMKGEWAGKQEFNTDDAPPMVGDATNRIEEAIGGRYLEERLSTTLPGRKPTDTRHMITFDPATQTYRAWWFNDTSVAPTEFEGKIEDGKLVLFSKPRAPQSPRMRATYFHHPSLRPERFLERQADPDLHARDGRRRNLDPALHDDLHEEVRGAGTPRQ